MNGRIQHLDHGEITTSDDTTTGTAGRARIAPPLAMAAETPQIEMPEASGAAHSRRKPNRCGRRDKPPTSISNRLR